eukprot:CAMPEP_0195309230 /NCGR_PEP_ID=MMETSP0707-20130614/38635_1 /TAXON_ID=33640 /ORGANISM="Asterionellopsis glacialis, Strain CCMP134" /LENGTH=317 /DNA_ID=CAMNT_0040373527 /DNA_START=12 /DNA_END=965 /DNA_ORIENTATION=+
MSASIAVKRTLEKVTLRVFCSPSGTGGNPVTVFICKDDGAPLKQLTQTNLAKSCQWESVVAHVAPSIPVLSFYMPSGEEVSFCAHAAMGGIWAACSTSETFRMNVKYRTAHGGKTAKDVTLNGHRVGLYMNSQFQEIQLEEQEQQDTLEHLLLHHLKISPEAFVGQKKQKKWPSFCNSSVARPKTLVYLNSVDELHKAQAPTDADQFRKGCDALQSTGIYLYTRSNVGEFQCRQFPRASGYPEDPATGIAASALAVSLKLSGRANYPTFNILQGIAMGRPSKIIVEDVLLVGDIADLRCCGNIELEEREEIVIEENE